MRPQSSYKIKKGQKDFKLSIGLPHPEDYCIVSMPNWDTTVFQIEKTEKGFTLGFGTPCSRDDGMLSLTLCSPSRKAIVVRKSNTNPDREQKMKKPKSTNYV